eukprot:CAMPEP_0204829514 /NCGR_PEP_ID=MMETSP1346-20131115/7744_1 /ASSEMBLY_ACC=CAM_ASM_000771 /TAXON_ID=215587 /ORGANISM="Aplanochytrium stocchinoi, Strain GSBS06" /LENGTH=445 /DNA_ID=CAMNT_0051959391 /DNA_START=35 /DNA_END=1372 /DNA_ORIENTATION=-
MVGSLQILKVAIAIATCAIYFATALPDSELCLGECVGIGTEEVCTFKFKINIFAGDTGYYEVEGCNGIQPTLGMRGNVSYVFDQTDITNWFHPLGFSYGPDGVYRENLELEKFVSAPSPAQPEGSECNETLPCEYPQYPQYMLNGEALCDANPCDPADFGLDQYEGVYFSGGRDAWHDAGNFTVGLKVTDPATTEIFYFCHIHNGMSGRIKVLDSSGSQKDPNDIVLIPYEYDRPDQFEQECGVFNISQFRTGDSCKDQTFLCSDDSNNMFGQCMNAIDCAMHEEMRVTLNNDPTTVFMHQMIAHHRNAVNMAKILLKLNPTSLRCGTNYDGRRMLQEGEKPDFCHDISDDGGFPVLTLLWDIINGQNAQITFMESWLRDNGQPSHDNCDAKNPHTGYIAGIVFLAVAFVASTIAAIVFYKRAQRHLRSAVDLIEVKSEQSPAFA